MSATARGWVRPLVAVAIAMLASLALFWPGVAVFDTVSQYEQVVSGELTDWHPPIMARLWQVLRAVGPGTGPMLTIQMLGYWSGVGLIAAGLARIGRRWGSLGVLLIGCCPLFVGWQAVILKDSQMLGALLAATGLVAWWRLSERAVPWPVWAIVALLIGYAALVRANAVFACAPFAVMLLPWPTWRRTATALVGAVLLLGLSGPINHSLLGARATDVARTLPIFDLAGITAMGGQALGLTGAERQAIVARRCYTPFFWDPLGDDGHCAEPLDRLHTEPAPALFHAWVASIAANPVAYVAHRLAHLNETDRFITPTNRPGAAPTAYAEQNDLGLRPVGSSAKRFQQVGGWLSASPIGWPAIYIGLALALTLGTWRDPATPERRLARALIVSALTLEASFAVVSIASDLRYHLWSMMATLLATVLLASAGIRRRAVIVALVAVSLVAGVGTAARLSLPPGPATYQGML